MKVLTRAELNAPLPPWYIVALYPFGALLSMVVSYAILYLLSIYPLLWLVLMAPGFGYEIKQWWSNR